MREVRKGKVPAEGEAYKADELESRLKALARSRQAELDRADMDGTDGAEVTSEMQAEEAGATAAAQEAWMDQEDLDLMGKVEEYSFDLEEPEFDPGHFGIRHKRPEYQTVIKLRPELDPELEADEIEEIRRLGAIRRQTERKRRSRVSREQRYLCGHRLVYDIHSRSGLTQGGLSRLPQDTCPGRTWRSWRRVVWTCAERRHRRTGRWKRRPRRLGVDSDI